MSMKGYSGCDVIMIAMHMMDDYTLCREDIRSVFDPLDFLVV